MLINKKEKYVKCVILGVLLIVLASSLVNAQQNTITDPGTTPDSLFWGLDKAFDQISLLLTTGDVDKAKKGLEIAEERLAEIREMIEENKLGDAEKAKKAHSKTLSKVINNVEEIEGDNSEEEIKELIEVEKELHEHEQKVEQTSGELKIKIEVEGELTQEQRDLIDSILASLEGQTGEVEIKIKNKKDGIKIKIKQETGKDDKEIEGDIEKFEIEAGMDRIKVKAKIIGDQSGVKIEKRFSTTTTDRAAIINEIMEKFVLNREIADVALKIEEEEGDEELEEKLKVEVKVKEGVAKVKVKLKFILNTTDREEILNAVVENSQLIAEQIESALKFRDKDKDEEEDEDQELEIEVEVEDGIAEVKIGFAGEELEFSLETTDKEAIISEIVARTGLSEGEVRDNLEFEAEDEEDESDEEDEESEEEEDSEGKEEDEE